MTDLDVWVSRLNESEKEKIRKFLKRAEKVRIN